jgi:hypothetical protein
MLKLFLFKNNQIILNNPTILLVKEFKELWDQDKTEEKDYAYKVFAFMFLMEDFRSPLKDFTENERLVKSLESSKLTDMDITKPTVKNAIKAYRDIINSKLTLKLIRGILHSAHQLCEFFDTINFREKVTEGQNKGKLQHDVTKYFNMLKQVRPTLKELSELEDSLKKELETDDSEKTIRGGAKQSRLMKEALNNE